MDITLNLLPWQSEFLQSKKRIKILTGAAGTGKSHICRLHLALHCLQYPGSKTIVAIPKYRQAQQVIIEPLLQLLGDLGLDFYFKYKKGEGRVIFKNKSIIDIFSTDFLDTKLRGREINMAYIDEFTTIKGWGDHSDQEMVLSVIQRVLRQHSDNQHILISTNPGLKTDYLYRKFIQAPPENTYLQHLRFEEGYLKTDDIYSETLLNLSDYDRARYYYGEWGTLEGQAFDLKPGIHIQDINLSPTDEKYYLSFDYGFSPDPMVWLLLCVKEGKVYVVDDLELLNTSISKQEIYLKNWIDTYNILGYTGETGPGSGEVRSLLTHYKLKYYPTNKNRTEGWQKLNNYVEKETLIISSKCRYLANSLQSLTWVAGQNIDIDGSNDHASDALRYFLMSNIISSATNVRKFYVNTKGISQI